MYTFYEVCYNDVILGFIFHPELVTIQTLGKYFGLIQTYNIERLVITISCRASTCVTLILKYMYHSIYIYYLRVQKSYNY